jgi:ATP-dependent Clp protease ATP-binding subunit ClpB
VSLQLKQLQLRLEKRGFSLSWDSEVVELLYREGYNPAFGARPIKRAIQRLVEDPLSIQLLGGRFAPGSAIRLTLQGSEVVAL